MQSNIHMNKIKIGGVEFFLFLTYTNNRASKLTKITDSSLRKKTTDIKPILQSIHT